MGMWDLFALLLISLAFVHQGNAAVSANDFFLYVHLPKTAGSTFSFEFPNRYRRAGVHTCRGEHYGIPVSERTANLTDCNYLTYEAALPSLLRNVPDGKDVKVLTLLRNPVPLRISGLEFLAYRIGYIKDPHRFLARYEKDKPHWGELYPLHNFQTRQLSCEEESTTHPFENLGACDWSLQRAVKAVKEMFWVGITEYYKESMCVLDYKMGVFNRDVCQCEKQKTKFSNTLVVSGHVYSVEELKELEDLNRVDLLLYGVAVNRFFSDIAEVEEATRVQILCLE